MPQTALGNMGINFEHSLGADDWKNSYDANWIITDWSLQPWIINRTTTAEPGAPAVGDAYILGATRTGTDWGSDSGSAENSIAIRAAIPGLPDSSNWIYLVPREGWKVYDRGANVTWFFTGSAWICLGKNYRVTTAGSYEPVALDLNGVVNINNASHTLNIPDVATVPHRTGDRFTFINRHANAITVTDDASVTWLGQNLVSAGIAGNSICEIEATDTADEWQVLRNEPYPA